MSDLDRPPAAAQVQRRLAGSLLLSAAAVALLFALVRLAAPQPWSFDEYYHLGVARLMRSGLRIERLPSAAFSTLADRFADKEPLFHFVLLPFARLPIDVAASVGAVLGQLFVVAALAWALATLRAPRPGWFLLALGGLGPVLAYRLEMCRPHVWLIAFAILAMALLVERRPWALAVVAALAGLAHAGGWIVAAMALVWVLSGIVLRQREATLWATWRPLAAAVAGWCAGQLVHPELPANFEMLLRVNLTVPFEATAAGDAALRSQLGSELQPPDLDLLVAQWPIYLAAAAIVVGWVRGRWRDRASLATGACALAFVAVGTLAMRRMTEIGGPLALLALAVQLRGAGESLLASRRVRLLLGGLVLVGCAWTFAIVSQHAVGSPPRAMAEWLAGHGGPGERVFTVHWADSAPLFYFAPQLESLVLLDPTFFFLKDRQAFLRYVAIVEGAEAQPRRAIREAFGARWVTLWRSDLRLPIGERLLADGGARAVFADRDYVVLDLGSPAAAGGPRPGR
ncbi:MAG: hypothetical protein ACM3OB_04400 [Acidobacteriota bacterium]